MAPRKHKYFQVHYENGTFDIKDNESNGSTVAIGTPIFLSEKIAWDWLIDNIPNSLGCII